jgi:succinoglycan biosynthesis transport protein ExoP
MRAAAAEQTANWYGPQIVALRAGLTEARATLIAFQQSSSMLPQLTTGDSENSQLMAATQDLSTARATLSTLQSRRDAPSVDLTTDPQDPDVQVLTGLKTKLTDAQSNFEQMRSQLGANNPKVESAAASIRSLRAQIVAATASMRDHLDARIASTEAQIAKLTATRGSALRDMIAVQGQRERLNELQRDVAFRQDLLEAQSKSAAQAQLQSKLTFSNVAVLDRATPPATPAFPKPLLVLGVAAGGGLALGIILALLAEALDRRVRAKEDLAYAISAPVLGQIGYSRRLTGGRARLRLAAS